MLAHLIRKEVLDHLLSLRFLTLSALGTLIIWLSLFSGYTYYQSCLKDYRLAQAATEDRLRQIEAGNPRGENWEELNQMGFEVHNAPNPMSIFVRGLDPTQGRSISITGSTRQVKLSPVAGEPILALFPPLDLGLVVQVVLSLFVVLFTYDAISGEKEAGTLRMVASFAVPRDRLLLGKLLGVLVPVHLAFAVPSLLGIGILLLMPEVELSPLELGRLGLILLTFGLYLTVFMCAGLLSSCLTRRGATSFVLLLAFWVTSVAVVPRVNLIVAESLRPAMTSHQHLVQKALIKREIDDEHSRLRWKWRDEHPEYWQRTPESQKAFLDYSHKTREELEARYKPRMDNLDREFNNRYRSCLSLAVALSWLSPAFSLKDAALRLAGTDMDRQRRFEQGYATYEKALGEWGKMALYRDRQILATSVQKRIPYKWEVSDIPRFFYQDVWPIEDLELAFVDIGVLAVWGGIFFLGAYVRLLRYDLR